MCKVMGVGIDLCAIPRMEKLLAEGRFLPRYFTQGEQAYILSRGAVAADSMAGIWAAKEALMKAVGVGLGIPPTDVEILHTALGQPCYRLHGKALSAVQGGECMLSITHEGDMAAAVCVWQK